jgi:GntR family transcriptional regulator
MPELRTPPEAGTTLYRQVADRLLARIGSGNIGIGDSLPPEPVLAEEYAVSRHTMREALRILRELGIVDRKPGAGTIVKARGPQPSYIQIIRSPQELLQYPESTLSVHSSQPVRVNRQMASLLQCRTGERWLLVRALRRLKEKAARKGGGLPICWLDLYNPCTR